MAVRLGVVPGSLPPDIAALREWMDRMIARGQVRVTPEARRIARTVLYPLPWVPRLAWDAAHLVSLATLRPEIRRQYGIGWSSDRERGIERIAAASRRLLPLVPSPLRHAPQARAAQRRMSQLGGMTR